MVTLASELPQLRESEPVITPGDRLAMTLFVAIVTHLVVILGIVSVPHGPADSLRSTLDIVLVQRRAETPPDEADYLAQVNQEDGGNHGEEVRPATPMQAPLRGSEPNVVASVPPTPSTVPLALSNQETRTQHSVIAVVDTQSAPTPEFSATAPEPKRKPSIDSAAQDPALSEEQLTHSIKASDLIARSLAMASLTAEIDQRLQEYSKRPRRKWISARTREYRYAAYMEDWRIKVERIGNLNYPREARRKSLSGYLRLEVALNADGSINDIILHESSGHRVLDDAAVRIVELSAPFSPFPRAIFEETDILHIERTWRFHGSNQFSSR